MNLQSIFIDFDTDSVGILFEDKLYPIGTILPSVVAVEDSFKTAFGVDFSRVVIQLTDEQHGEQPRIVCQIGEDVSIINLAKFVAEQPALYVEIQAIRVELEAELTNIINQG
jgi:hypothetical protein